jgi:hypothetical protein
MTGQPDPHTQVHDDKPAGMLGDRLRLMFDWYKGMVDARTGRLGSPERHQDWRRIPAD